jgi:6-phosphogluconolactonase/glucosamine-6-phosphate isomerase/deaminase
MISHSLKQPFKVAYMTITTVCKSSNICYLGFGDRKKNQVKLFVYATANRRNWGIKILDIAINIK